jgi:transcriptional regulator with XRE-family HTH domain|nr:MAG TPA: helix-turn-helix domain protein [Caudoviricetes sp.]
MPTGAKIKEFRKQKGLTQKQLGDLCGMADSAIRRYENGKANPKIETLQKIATALKCNLSDLMDADEYKLHNIEIAIKKVNDSVLEKNKEIDNEPMTIAAHFDGDEYTEEELEAIREFAEFVKSKRK